MPENSWEAEKHDTADGLPVPSLAQGELALLERRVEEEREHKEHARLREPKVRQNVELAHVLLARLARKELSRAMQKAQSDDLPEAPPYRDQDQGDAGDPRSIKVAEMEEAPSSNAQLEI